VHHASVRGNSRNAERIKPRVFRAASGKLIFFWEFCKLDLFKNDSKEKTKTRKTRGGLRRSGVRASAAFVSGTKARPRGSRFDGGWAPAFDTIPGEKGRISSQGAGKPDHFLNAAFEKT
jgi:hypothetical protein